MMARVGAEDDESFTFESAVRGHHVFKRIWTPVNGQLLQVRAETGNERDPYAVATVQPKPKQSRAQNLDSAGD